jgi:hypothetical protein
MLIESISIQCETPRAAKNLSREVDGIRADLLVWASGSKVIVRPTDDRVGPEGVPTLDESTEREIRDIQAEMN